jgi:hypothetical protein
MLAKGIVDKITRDRTGYAYRVLRTAMAKEARTVVRKNVYDPKKVEKTVGGNSKHTEGA